MAHWKVQLKSGFSCSGKTNLPFADTITDFRLWDTNPYLAAIGIQPGLEPGGYRRRLLMNPPWQLTPARLGEQLQKEWSGGTVRAVLHSLLGGSFTMPAGAECDASIPAWQMLIRVGQPLVVPPETAISVIWDLDNYVCGYPLEMESHFDAPIKTLAPIVRLCLRSLQACSHDIYLDCPYYEQRMFVGDSLVEALITYAVHKDLRLARRSIERYDLSTDIGEQRNLAAQHPERVASMQTTFEAWRRGTNVQLNTLNPDCTEAAFRRLYIDTDPSRFNPLTADTEQWAQIHEWRKGMTAAPLSLPE